MNTRPHTRYFWNKITNKLTWKDIIHSSSFTFYQHKETVKKAWNSLFSQGRVISLHMEDSTVTILGFVCYCSVIFANNVQRILQYYQSEHYYIGYLHSRNFFPKLALKEMLVWTVITLRTLEISVSPWSSP